MITISFDAYDDWDVADEVPEYSKEDAMVDPAREILDRATGYTTGEVDEARLDAIRALQEYGSGRNEHALEDESVNVSEAYELLEMESKHIASVHENTEADLSEEKKDLEQALESFEKVKEDITSRGLDRKIAGLK